MPRLILLNGAPAVGKSTLARRYAEDHPFALVLDIDHVRRMLGRWREDPGRAGLLARSVALAAARAHLDSGHDVVVPQMVARVEFIEQLAVTAAESEARFCEVFVLDDSANLLRRFAERSRLTADPTHADPHGIMTDGGSGLHEWADRIAALVPLRSDAATIACVPGDVEETYRRLLGVLAGR